MLVELSPVAVLNAMKNTVQNIAKNLLHQAGSFLVYS